MTILKEYNFLFQTPQKSYAIVKAKRANNKVLAITRTGQRILLTGNLEVGKACFYDRETATIISEAPTLDFIELPV